MCNRGCVGWRWQMLGMTMLNNQIPVNLIAISDKFVASSVVAVMCSAVPLYAFCIKLLMVRTSCYSVQCEAAS